MQETNLKVHRDQDALPILREAFSDQGKILWTMYDVGMSSLKSNAYSTH